MTGEGIAVAALRVAWDALHSDELDSPAYITNAEAVLADLLEHADPATLRDALRLLARQHVAALLALEDEEFDGDAYVRSLGLKVAVGR